MLASTTRVLLSTRTPGATRSVGGVAHAAARELLAAAALAAFLNYDFESRDLLTLWLVGIPALHRRLQMPPSTCGSSRPASSTAATAPPSSP